MDQSTQDMNSGGATEHIDMRDGDDFVCPNCGCEIMLKHHGDPARMPQMQLFTCCCGTPMQFEHPRGPAMA